MALSATTYDARGNESVESRNISQSGGIQGNPRVSGLTSRLSGSSVDVAVSGSGTVAIRKILVDGREGRSRIRY